MKTRWFVAIVLLVVSCSQGTPAASVQSTPSPTPAAGSSCRPATSYGLLLSQDFQLQVIDTCGNVKASAPFVQPYFAACFDRGPDPNIAPPVSATADRIYYRDGYTQIKYLTLSGETGLATAVPGGPTTVSSFSISPDDKRIAVVREDFQNATNFSVQLYIEDVQGGGNRVDLYSSSQPVDTGNTLWPMVWHGSQLVLAAVKGCGTIPGGISPVEWHVVDSATGNRLVTVANHCVGILSRWPSPAGIARADFNFGITFYNWTGATFGNGHQSENANDIQSGISPSGKYFFTGGELSETECGLPHPSTCVDSIDRSTSVGRVPAPTVACLFIDDEHLLTPQGVIDMNDRTTVAGFPAASRIKFQGPGHCGGRFPGGL